MEQLDELYLRDPEALDPSWREHFKRWVGANGHSRSPGGSVGPTFTPRSLFHPTGAVGSVLTDEPADLQHLQHQVGKLVRNYRVRGHRAAGFDPLGHPRLICRLAGPSG